MIKNRFRFFIENVREEIQFGKVTNKTRTS